LLHAANITTANAVISKKSFVFIFTNLSLFAFYNRLDANNIKRFNRYIKLFLMSYLAYKLRL
jgi:hypothetical protein